MPKPERIKPEHADALRRGYERVSPDAPFVVDFADPHNPFRAATAEERAAMDADQKAFAEAQRLGDRDAKARAGLPVAEREPVTTG
jgi:hypothetical protein